jgi:hypothetical protein
MCPVMTKTKMEVGWSVGLSEMEGAERAAPAGTLTVAVGLVRANL